MSAGFEASLCDVGTSLGNIFDTLIEWDTLSLPSLSVPVWITTYALMATVIEWVSTSTY